MTLGGAPDSPSEEDMIMTIIGTPCLAMLLVLANIALCLTAEAQKQGTPYDPATMSTFTAIPLGGYVSRDQRRATVLLTAGPE